MTLKEAIDNGFCYDKKHKLITNIKNTDLIEIVKIKTISSEIKFKEVPKFVFEIPNLFSFQASNQEIESLQELGKCEKLKSLYLSNNNISKIERLENCIDLEFLNLDNNQISDIEGLEKLTNLQELNLSKI